MSETTNRRGKSGRVRRSYNQVSYRAIAMLPIGPVPAACLPKPPSPAKLQRLRKRWSRAAAVVAMMAVMVPVATFADVIYTTYLAPKREAPTTAQLTGGVASSVIGMETFDTRPVAGSGSAVPFTSNLGTGGVITGTFTGTFGIAAADQYGGAGNTGRYLTTTSPTGISIKLNHTAAVKGVNYLGLDISALNDGNIIELLREGSILASFNSTTLRTLLKKCPDVKNLYCSNPTTAQNPNEQYAYVNFFDLTGYFDEVKLRQEAGGGFETDNFIAAFREDNVPFGESVAVPEPASALMVVSGLLGVLLVRRRVRRDPLKTPVAVA